MGVVCIHTLLTVHLAGPCPIKLLWICCMNSHSATNGNVTSLTSHDDVIKWKHFARYWPFVYFPHKGQWRGALMFFFIFAWTNGWGNNRYDGDFRRHRAHCNVTVIIPSVSPTLAIDYVRQLLCVTLWCIQKEVPLSNWKHPFPINHWMVRLKWQTRNLSQRNQVYLAICCSRDTGEISGDDYLIVFFRFHNKDKLIAEAEKSTTHLVRCKYLCCRIITRYCSGELSVRSREFHLVNNSMTPSWTHWIETRLYIDIFSGSEVIIYKNVQCREDYTPHRVKLNDRYLLNRELVSPQFIESRLWIIFLSGFHSS